MWESILGIVSKLVDWWTGKEKAKAEDPDVKTAAKAQTVVETRDRDNATVAAAMKTGDLDAIRKAAGE